MIIFMVLCFFSFFLFSQVVPDFKGVAEAYSAAVQSVDAVVLFITLASAQLIKRFPKVKLKLLFPVVLSALSAVIIYWGQPTFVVLAKLLQYCGSSMFLWEVYKYFFVKKDKGTV